MANTSVSYVDLDFDTLKNGLKAYLRGNAIFKDYDFEGSNLTLLLDLLAYNTHKNAFYTNMLFSEAFLDSAQLRSSIISHAKELNYLPISSRSAKAKIEVSFEASGQNQPYIIEKGSLFSTVIKNQAYAFSIPEALTVSSATINSVSNSYVFNFTTDIYEGFFVKDTYVYQPSNDPQTFLITNKNIDTSSIKVAVYEDNDQVAQIYKLTETLLGLTPTSAVFFLQGTGNGYYEILFGDGVLGKKPKQGSQIVIDYRISSGPNPNGARTFSLDFDPTNNGEMTGIKSVNTLEAASGGSDAQSIELIRQYAPRYFATQQRAVSSDDYASLVLSKFPEFVDDVVVYGGETLEPKLYGRVVVAVKPLSGDVVPSFVKQQINNYLLDYVSIPTRVIISDPNTFHCEITSTVQYDPKITTKTRTELQNVIYNAIIDFKTLNLNRFNRDFRYSKFVRAIDDADDAVVSNDTTVTLIKKLYPTPNKFLKTEINFNNQLHPARGIENRPVLFTTSFTYIDENNISYPLSRIEDNGFGVLIVKSPINGRLVDINKNIGTIDHSKGVVKINDLLLSDYGNVFAIHVQTAIKDIVVNQSSVLNIDPEDINVTVIGVLE